MLIKNAFLYSLGISDEVERDEDEEEDEYRNQGEENEDEYRIQGEENDDDREDLPQAQNGHEYEADPKAWGFRRSSIIFSLWKSIRIIEADNHIYFTPAVI